MKSLCLEKTGSLKLQNTPVPEILPELEQDESLLKVTHCAVCRTDAKMWKMGHRDLVLPRVLGHEICGYIEKSGKRFVLWPGDSCGTCAQCRSGAENLCRYMKITGFNNNGGFAEYVAVKKRNLIPIPDALPGKVACLAEPLACTINAAYQADVMPGDEALIFGAGPVGLMAALALKEKGAKPFIIEINSDKLKCSEEFRKKTSIKADVKFERSDFDIIINAAPSIETFLTGINRLDKGGRFCIFSGFTNCSTLPADLLNEVHYRQLKISGAYGCTRRNMEEAVVILLKYKEEFESIIDCCISLEHVSLVIQKILAGEALKFVVKL